MRRLSQYLCLSTLLVATSCTAFSEAEPANTAEAAREPWQQAEDTEVWEPVPPVVAAEPGQPPSDAIVLFDGSARLVGVARVREGETRPEYRERAIAGTSKLLLAYAAVAEAPSSRIRALGQACRPRNGRLRPVFAAAIRVSHLRH